MSCPTNGHLITLQLAINHLSNADSRANLPTKMNENRGFHSMRLWYEQSANIWEEALPLGNGRLGAMVYGGIWTEHLQLNEESVWYGAPVDRNNPDALENLPKIRELLRSGHIKEAERLMRYALSGTPQSQHPYQSLGDMTLRFYPCSEEITAGAYTAPMQNVSSLSDSDNDAKKNHESGIPSVTDYYRELNLNSATSVTEFTFNSIHYRREVFVSHPDDCLVMHITSDGQGAINLDALLTRERFYDGAKKLGNSTICLYGNLGKGGLDFQMQLHARSVGGTVRVIGEHLIVEEADEVTLFFCAGTTFRMKQPEQEIAGIIAKAAAFSYEELLQRHVTDYQSLFNRVTLKLVSEEESHKADAQPTDVRMQQITEGREDIALMQTYFQFGRYLLISCSRPGTLPATLQGLWNHQMKPSWDSKYTININTEMNYWPSESCNLSECHLPLFDLIERMVPNGEHTAKVMYGCRGFVAHHNTDIWGDTAVQDHWISGSYWVMGAAWLCTHQWTHYLYTGDRDFLQKQFPIMRKAALFFLDFLIEDQGYLKTCPSVSPENTYILSNGERGANGVGCTMDNQILRDLFTQCIKAAEILGVEDELNEQIKEALGKLMPTRIGHFGQIMEWEEDYEEAEPGHRHISHLYGLFPSDQISVDETPKLAQAARVTLERRLSHGGGHTGWSRAWIINHYAKLMDGEQAYFHLQKILEKSTLTNLFDNHPPFQIDGNFGATAAIANMLVQCNEKRVILLPALPEKWADGSVSGLCIVGGAEVSLEWKCHRLVSFSITAKQDWCCLVRYGDWSAEISMKEGEQFTKNFE